MFSDTDWADDDVNENMGASQTNDFAGSSTVFSPAFVLAMHQNVVEKVSKITFSKWFTEITFCLCIDARFCSLAVYFLSYPL